LFSRLLSRLCHVATKVAAEASGKTVVATVVAVANVLAFCHHMYTCLACPFSVG